MDSKALFHHWSEVREALFQALDCLSDAQLDFVPREGLWSLRETVCHIAGTEEGWFRYCVTREHPGWPDYPARDYPTVASLKALLADVHARTEQFLAADADERMLQPVALPWGAQTTLGWVVWHVLEHEIHHRGEVFLMLGLMGKEAPDV
jgi:uncharacterized damage-inducible protein DinB